MNYKKINKSTARKMYYNGCNILLLPCKVSELALNEEYNTWVKPVTISLVTSTDNLNQFDRSVNAFEYYNCSYAKLGYYSHFYVSEEDYNSYQMCKIMCN